MKLIRIECYTMIKPLATLVFKRKTNAQQSLQSLQMTIVLESVSFDPPNARSGHNSEKNRCKQSSNCS